MAEPVVQKHETLAAQLTTIGQEWRETAAFAPNAAAHGACLTIAAMAERAALAHLDLARALEAVEPHIADPESGGFGSEGGDHGQR